MIKKEGQTFHVGVYGIFINNGKLLVIKKARGPYTGMLDLPGGGIEFGEKIEACLSREIMEETGATLNNCQFISYNENFCNYFNKDNEPRQLHHIGIYFLVDILFDKIKRDADGFDSLGADFVDVDNLEILEITPIAKPAILKAISMLKNR
jgi:8-oxo-dGTP pyrophosphatase MutT (NUDIX family)